MTNHCSFRWKQYSPPVKADFLRDFRSLQQHPMLLSAYLKEPTPQSSAGSFSGFSMVLKTGTVKEPENVLITGFMVGPGSDRWSNR